MDFFHAAVAFSAAFVAGAINSIAGGGTLISFPALVWLGLPSLTANATNTVALWPGSLGGMLGFRKELEHTDRWLLSLVFPSIVGGIAGAMLLRWTAPAIFDLLVPFLILFATLLFMAQQPIQQRLNRGVDSGGRLHVGIAIGFQFLVALYGGYFGAGIGILMLAALSILGVSDIHRMNALKNFFALCINGVAAVYFAWAGMVSWPDALVMALGATIGGYAGAGAARRLGRVAVRRLVVVLGFTMALALALRAR